MLSGIKIMRNDISSSECLSALWDGELKDDEWTCLFSSINESEQKQAWHANLVIRDVLLNSHELHIHDALNVSDRVVDFLRQEVNEKNKKQVNLLTASQHPSVLKNAVNDPVFQWKKWSGLWSLGLVAVMGWSLWISENAQFSIHENVAINHVVSSATAPIVGGSINVSSSGMVRDARLDELMSARQQVSGANNLQPPVDYLRNASFEKSN